MDERESSPLSPVPTDFDAESPSKNVAENADSPSENVADDVDLPLKNVTEDVDSSSKGVAKDGNSPSENVAEDVNSPSKNVAEDVNSPSKKLAEDVTTSKDVAKDVDIPPTPEKGDPKDDPKPNMTNSASDKGIPQDQAESPGAREEPVDLSSPPPEAQNDEPVYSDTRSSRKRKPMARYAEEIETMPPPAKRPATSKKETAATTRKQQPVRGNWSPSHLLSSSKSKLATCNISDLLNNERAWTSLARNQQLHLISMLPGASIPSDLPEDVPLPNMLKEALRSNLSFQADVRLFQEDLAAGRYERKWLADAQSSIDKRAAGKFDSWKEKNREEFWGQKQKIAAGALAGESSQHTLPTLVEGQCFMVGDVWRLNRSRMQEKPLKKIVVEKEARITSISDGNLLSFSFPPGVHVISSPANGKDVQVSGVDSPIVLSNAILNEDGRIVGVRGANSWKEFRCFRKNQDMGSLFDIRELYHSRSAAKATKSTI